MPLPDSALTKEFVRGLTRCLTARQYSTRHGPSLSQTRAMRQSDSPVAGNLATFVKCHEWLAPEVLEARRRQLGVPHRVLDILVPEVIL